MSQTIILPPICQHVVTKNEICPHQESPSVTLVFPENPQVVGVHGRWIPSVNPKKDLPLTCHDLPNFVQKLWGLNPLVCIVFGGNLQGHQHLDAKHDAKMMQNWLGNARETPESAAGNWVFEGRMIDSNGDWWGFSSKPWFWGTSRLFFENSPTAWDLGAPEVAAICTPHTKIVLEMSAPPGCWMNKLRFRCDSTFIPSHTISGSKPFHRYVCQTGSTWLTLLCSCQCPVLKYGNEYWPRTISPVISLKII